MSDSGAFFTIGKGGPPPEEDVEDGTYPLTLVAIDDAKRIFTKLHPENPPGSGLGGTMIVVWRFALDDDRIVEGATSPATGPKSKAFGWIGALLGKPPELGAEFGKDDLIGRMAYGAVVHNDAGYPRVNDLVAMPRSAKVAPAPAGRSAPVAIDAATGLANVATQNAPAAPAAPAVEAVAVAAKPADDDLGF